MVLVAFTDTRIMAHIGVGIWVGALADGITHGIALTGLAVIMDTDMEGALDMVMDTDMVGAMGMVLGMKVMEMAEVLEPRTTATILALMLV